MAATTGVISGTDLRLYIGGSAVAYATDCTLSIEREFIETIHKDNPGDGWREGQVQQKSGTMTVSALYNHDGANNTPGTLFTALDDGTSLTGRLTTDAADDTYYEFSCFCTSFNVNAAVNENAAFDCEFTISGAVTKGTAT